MNHIQILDQLQWQVYILIASKAPGASWLQENCYCVNAATSDREATVFEKVSEMHL